MSEKEAGHLLYPVEQLCHLYNTSNPDFTRVPDHRAQFDTCIALLESRDLIHRLSFGDYVLLRPELLDVYAAAFVNAAKDDPDGCLLEEDARNAKFAMDPEERLKNRDQERLLLIATVEELMRHEIALRDGAYLVFPSQLTKTKPDLPETLQSDTVYRFHGPVANVYATLIVRLTHSGIFRRSELWKNAAVFRGKFAGACGIGLVADDEESAEITLYFDKESTRQTKFQFDDYVNTHLKRWALPESLVRRKIIRCGRCNEALTESQVVRRLDAGFKSTRCCVCESEISLVDSGERMAELGVSLVATIDIAADDRRDRSAAQSILQGKREVGEFDVFLCHNSCDKEQVKVIGAKLKGKGVLPWLDEWELRPGLPWQRELEKVMSRIKSAAVFVGPSGIGPWQEQEVDTFLREFVRRHCPVIPVLLPNIAAVRGSLRVRRYGKSQEKATGGLREDAGFKLGVRGPGVGDLSTKVEPRPIPPLPKFLEGMTWVDFRKKTPNPLERLVWGITGKQRI